MTSEFLNGFWGWDEVNQTLEFYKYPPDPNIVVNPLIDEGGPKYLTRIRFRDNTDPLSKATFKNVFGRKANVKQTDVVTVQDLKDVVLFSAEPADLSVGFVQFLFTERVDKFLRAAIVYFNYYFFAWEFITKRREDRKTKISQPSSHLNDDIVRDNLVDLRCVLAKEHAAILRGMGDAKQFHHMKTNLSQTERESFYFEALISITVRVVWHALQKKNFALVETELNRLIRGEVFNVVEHRKVRIDTFDTTTAEKQILNGKPEAVKCKTLLQRSPLIRTLLTDVEDYKLLAIGAKTINTNQLRQQFLELAFTAPEELLYELDIGIGLLGYPRRKLDAFLAPKERTQTDLLERELYIPSFDIPMKEDDPDEIFTEILPLDDAMFKETNVIKERRKMQCKKWTNFLKARVKKQLRKSILKEVATKLNLNEEDENKIVEIFEDMSIGAKMTRRRSKNQIGGSPRDSVFTIASSSSKMYGSRASFANARASIMYLDEE